MRLSFTCIGALALAVVLSLMSTRDLTAQEKKAQKAEQKKENIQGTISNMSKDVFTVRTTDGASPITRQVLYDAKTKFRYGHSKDNKPGDVSKVKMQYFISCEGNFNDKQQLMAEVCVYREAK